MRNWWNWLLVRPERMLLTLGAVYILGATALLYEMHKPPSFPTHPRIAGSESYTAEEHAAWQEQCKRLDPPGYGSHC